MKMKKEYKMIKKNILKRYLSFLLMVSLVLQSAVVLKNSSSRAAEDEKTVLGLYEADSLISEFASITDAFAAMTNPEGDYTIIFNDVQTDYILTGVVWFPKVKSITLVGSMHNSNKTTTLFIDNDLYLQSDLTLENFAIYQKNIERDTRFFLKNHKLSIEGKGTEIKSSPSYDFLLVGDNGSDLEVKNCYFRIKDIIVDTIVLKEKGDLHFEGSNAAIQAIQVLPSQVNAGNDIQFGGTRPCNIQIGKIYLENNLFLKYMPIGELKIGSVESGVSSNQYLNLGYESSKFSIYEYPHCTIEESRNVEVRCDFCTVSLSEESYQALRNEISCLKAPSIDISEIKYYFYNHVTAKRTPAACTKDAEGNVRFEPIITEPPKEEPEAPVALGIKSTDNQGIYYKLDKEHLTAVVGRDIDMRNSSDWTGANDGVIKIPEKVSKDGKIYTVTRIGAGAFCYCDYSIKKLTLPDTITSIGDDAFHRAHLPEIIIGKNVSSIGSCALSGSVEKIYVHPENKYFTTVDGILFDNEKKTLVQVPDTSYLFCKDYTVPDSVETIADGAFYAAKILHIRADSVKKIGKNVFVLSRVEDFSGENVTEIGESAFQQCTKLYYIYFGEKLDTIGNYAFRGCESLEVVLLPDSVSHIKSAAFWECKNLKYFIGASHTAYLYGTVDTCPKLVLFQLSDTAEELPSYQFYECTSLEKLYLPECYQIFNRDVFFNTGEISVYALPKHKMQIEGLSKTYVDRSEHVHTPYLITETLKMPTETLKGIEVTYCRECHYVESSAFLPPTGLPPAEPTPSAPEAVSTPTPVPAITPTPEPTLSLPIITPTAVPSETELPTVTASPSAAPEEASLAPSDKPINSPEPPADSSGNAGSGSGSGGGSVGGGGSSGGGGSQGGGGGIPGGSGSGGNGGTNLATPSPSPSPTSEITVTPSPTPMRTEVPFVTPSPLPEFFASPTPVPGTSFQNGIKLVKAEFTSLKLNTYNQPVLRWKKKQPIRGYLIYRSLKKTTGYQLIYEAKQNVTKYTDKSAKPGKKYYYRIRVYQRSGKAMKYGKYSVIRNIRLLSLLRPKITAKKGVTVNRIYYIQIQMRKYSGSNVALYLKKGKSYSRIQLKSGSIKKYHGIFKLQCNRQHKVYYLKARTYIIKNGKKYYSPYSNTAKVRI